MAKRVKIDYLGYCENCLINSLSPLIDVWQLYKVKAPGTLNQKAYRFVKAHGLVYCAWCYTYPNEAAELLRICKVDWLRS